MKRILFATLILLSALPASAHKDHDSAVGQEHRSLLGFVEWITLEPAGLRLKARLDTGASTASLHSIDTEAFEHDGEEWVRFRVPVTDHREIDDDVELRALTFERPVERTLLIKRKGAPSQRRYVVELPLCLNGRRHEAEFSLTDRGDFNYPALLGRRFLGDLAVVDPGESFLATDDCEHTGLDEFEERILEVETGDRGSRDGEEEAE